MSQQIMDAIEQRQFKSDIPEFREGDTVRVGVRVVGVCKTPIIGD